MCRSKLRSCALNIQWINRERCPVLKKTLYILILNVNALRMLQISFWWLEKSKAVAKTLLRGRVATNYILHNLWDNYFLNSLSKNIHMNPTSHFFIWKTKAFILLRSRKGRITLKEMFLSHWNVCLLHVVFFTIFLKCIVSFVSVALLHGVEWKKNKSRKKKMFDI